MFNIIAINANDLMNNFNGICDLVVSGEIVIVSRSHNQNVVVISEEEFNLKEKVIRNVEYLDKIDKGIEDLRQDKIIIKTIEELDDMAR